MAELSARSAFDGLLAPIGAGAGVTVREVTGFGLATILARDPAALAAAFGVTLPSGPVSTQAAGLTMLGTSRATWLVFADGEAALARSLTAKLRSAAHVADQSGAYGILDLAGPHARDVLAKGLPIDLDPAAFAADAVAVSHIAQIGAIVWRIPGGFRLATPRSSAGSFWHWLAASAAEFGLVLG
jgi:sarcosine oxidase subunit gamma